MRTMMNKLYNKLYDESFLESLSGSWTVMNVFMVKLP